jgi:hypothetical protein
MKYILTALLFFIVACDEPTTTPAVNTDAPAPMAAEATPTTLAGDSTPTK